MNSGLALKRFRFHKSMDNYLSGSFGFYPEQITYHQYYGQNTSAFGVLSERIAQIERMLDSAERQNKQRDKLAEQLHNIEDKVDEALFERRNRSEILEPEDLSLQERLEAFLHWREQLQIFYSAIERSLELLKRQGAPREEIRRLQEIKDETSEHLYQSDWLSEAARDKLEDLRNDNDLAAYSLQRSKIRGRDPPNAPIGPRVSNATGNRNATGAGMQSFRGILDEAEKIRSFSQETSLRMENEVETLKGEGRSLAKEIADLHKVLESQKQQLVDVTRMKKENERERKYKF